MAAKDFLQGLAWAGRSLAVLAVGALLYWVYRTHVRYDTRPPPPSVSTLVLYDPKVHRTRRNLVPRDGSGDPRLTARPPPPRRIASERGRRLASRLQADRFRCRRKPSDRIPLVGERGRRVARVLQGRLQGRKCV